MLMMLGSVQFTVAPFNTHENDRDAATDYVEKPVIGRRPPLEYVGEGVETRTIRGKIFPQAFGGLDGLQALDGARQSGTAQYLMRGDGVPLGWFVIEKVTEKSSKLDGSGVGRIVEFEATLKRDDAPSASGYVTSVMGMLGL